MSEPTLTRRLFLADLGRGGLAIAVLGVAACSPAGSGSSPTAPVASGSGVGPTGGLAPSSSASAAPGSVGPAPGGSVAPGGLTWTRVNLGFVSAYVLVRGGEAAIVDTGVAGSEVAIEAALTGVGLGWGSVGHVILTHKHGDHAGSASAVLTAASTAAGYIGTADLAAVQTPRALNPVDDGDTVFGLRVVGTPGHTAGHVAVLDEAAGVLVVGDALRTSGGTLMGSSPQNTEDATAAAATVVKLGALTFETLLVGHGEPILTGASAQVKALGG